MTVAWISSTSGKAFGACTLISLLPNVLLFLLPSWILVNGTDGQNSSVQNILMTFAAGGLLGDVFIHILPDLMESSAQHDKHNHSDHSYDDGQCHIDLSKLQYTPNQPSCDVQHLSGAVSSIESFWAQNHSACIGILALTGFIIFVTVDRLAKIQTIQKFRSSNDSTESNHMSTSDKQQNSNDVSSAYLNLLADRLAMGASFSRGNTIAFATVLSVLFHEIPHEIGDMTILMKSGYTKWQAIRTQFVTAIAAFLGTGIGLSFKTSAVAEDVLLSLTCGGFIFVAVVSLLSPVLQGTPASARQIVAEILSFAVGVGIMVLVLFLESLGDDHSH